ncbi:MAG: gamma-glutamyl-gamma-aminobutyrate hydrolase family protein [Xanthomonadales bacterium]|nr:Gamma-glutamyl-gamma-aminobutyrate hydrolase PuuD [Xanthomonadales bacterium]MCC6592900.1 gamma-glutamyl-gamma-aminobutyrate hydrolase family protein [Xanthomonadales bacterium]MCE7930771.1 gamma-glutamyl-gamma-aminobutyrate hydrolase family protein [Xanthomonadales bacterium PRO6]
MAKQPLIGVPCDRKIIGPHPFQAVGEKYLRALVDTGCGTPLSIPSLDPPLDLPTLLERLDGIFLTGSYSNIEPHHYGNEPSWEGNPHDAHRDANTLPLVLQAVRARVPVLAVCRGLQEVNVAFGGTLLQKVHATVGHHDHREDQSQPLDVQYAPAHAVTLAPGGLLHSFAGDTAMVNSLHGQGIRSLGNGLAVEATAPDGLIEAVRLASGESFLLAVQWHPEWKVLENDFYRRTFEHFAQAVRAHADARS